LAGQTTEEVPEGFTVVDELEVDDDPVELEEVDDDPVELDELEVV